jgi:hypothetical protein
MSHYNNNNNASYNVQYQYQYQRYEQRLQQQQAGMPMIMSQTAAEGQLVVQQNGSLSGRNAPNGMVVVSSSGGPHYPNGSRNYSNGIAMFRRRSVVVGPSQQQREHLQMMPQPPRSVDVNNNNLRLSAFNADNWNDVHMNNMNRCLDWRTTECRRSRLIYL